MSTEAPERNALTPGTIAQLDPRTIQLLRNVREAQPDPGLVDSIRAVGVLEPVTVVTDEDGNPVARFGHRRILAAIQAEQHAIPAYVAGPADATETGEIHRLITQRDENTHRVGLTTKDEAEVVGQLAAFGLTYEQIEQQARIGQERIRLAHRVSSSKLAKAAAERYDLTLDQAAVMSEFEDDKDALTRLVASLQTGRFEHTAQALRDERRDADLKRALTKQLEADGIRVIERPSWSDSAKPLSQLKASREAKTSEPLTVETHAECPGHVAWPEFDWAYARKDGTVLDDETIEREREAYEAACNAINDAAEEAGVEPDEDAYPDDPSDAYERVRVFKPEYGCDDPKKHGHVDRFGGSGSSGGAKPAAEMSDEEREKAKAARKLVIDNNKAWKSATTVRRDWLKQFATRKTPPKGAGAFIAQALIQDRGSIANDPGFIAELGITEKVKGAYGVEKDVVNVTGVSEARATHLALVTLLAYYEAEYSGPNGDAAWRHDGTSNATGRYLRFLQSAGYTLSEVEEYAISKQTV